MLAIVRSKTDSRRKLQPVDIWAWLCRFSQVQQHQDNGVEPCLQGKLCFCLILF